MAARSTKTPIDTYLSKLPANARAALERLRGAIHAAVPGLQECLSYGVPGFRHPGGVLVWFAAAKSHLSFFPGGIVAEFADELAGFDTAKGTVRFTPERPLPLALVRRIVRRRAAVVIEKAERAAQRRAARRAPAAKPSARKRVARMQAPKPARRTRTPKRAGR